MLDLTKWEIPDLDTKAMEACRLRIDNLTKPIYSLAHLELMAERIAGITGEVKPNNLRKHILVWAADHKPNYIFSIGGKNFYIANQAKDNTNLGQLGAESLTIVKRFNKGKSSTNAVAKNVGATVSVVNIGLFQNTENLQNIENPKTFIDSVVEGDNISPEQAINEALQLGLEQAEHLAKQGAEVVALGNIGEYSNRVAIVLTHILTETPIVDLLKDTASVYEPGTERKAASIDCLQEFTTEEIYYLLQTMGGYEIIAMVGFIIGAASQQMAVIFDNTVTGAAILLASAINEKVKDYIFASAVYNNPVQDAQLQYLKMKAYLHYDFTIAEGLGSALGLSLLDASMHMLNDMKTFGEATVAVAEDGPGNIRQDWKV